MCIEFYALAWPTRRVRITSLKAAFLLGFAVSAQNPRLARSSGNVLMVAVNHCGEFQQPIWSVKSRSTHTGLHNSGYRETFASSPVSYPHHRRSTLRCTFPFTGSDTDLSCSVEATWWVRCALYAGCWSDWTICPWRENSEFPYPQQKEPRSILGSPTITTLTSICIFSPYHQA